VFAHTELLLAAVRATQGSVGERVTFTWMTFRDCSSMIKKAKSGRKKRSVTCKKSQAHTSAAWLRKNVLQFCPLGRFERLCLIYFWMVRLTSPNIQFEYLATYPLRSPEPVVSRHLLDQADRFRRKPRLSCMHLRFALPEYAEELTRPSRQRRLPGPGRAFVSKSEPSWPGAPAEAGLCSGRQGV
jgi:hypothetical protein